MLIGLQTRSKKQRDVPQTHFCAYNNLFEVAESEVSTPLIPKPATGYDPEAVPLTSIHKPISCILILSFHLLFCTSSDNFLRDFAPNFYNNL
jgi:hypothetical protein